MAISKTTTASAPKKAPAKKTTTPKTTAKATTPKKVTVKKTTSAKKASPKKASPKAKPSPEALYKMTEVAAYYIALNHGFSGSPTDYWIAAEAQISALYK